ncbi:MAG: DMT family transporter [Leptolyngbya sp. SIO1D8]|nr:DMT family transporter [Leptolyngbya sp. SIO1D8]
MNAASILKQRHHQGILLLLLTTLIWGTSFPLLKYIVNDLSPAVILTVRFTIAAIAFAPWLRQINLGLLRDGALLGSLYFAECTVSLIALETISANRSAFIISLNVILVPLLGTLLGRHLPMRVVIAALLAILGVGILSWEGGGLSQSDVLTFGCACGAATYILLLEKLIPRHPSLPLVATQLLTMALLSWVWAVPQLIDQFEMMTHHFSGLVYVGLMVTATPVWTQTLAQRWLAAYEAALLYTLEPVFATLFSFWFLGETLGVRGLLGAGIILLATAISQNAPKGLVQFCQAVRSSPLDI